MPEVAYPATWRDPIAGEWLVAKLVGVEKYHGAYGVKDILELEVAEAGQLHLQDGKGETPAPRVPDPGEKISLWANSTVLVAELGEKEVRIGDVAKFVYGGRSPNPDTKHAHLWKVFNQTRPALPSWIHEDQAGNPVPAPDEPSTTQDEGDFDAPPF